MLLQVKNVTKSYAGEAGSVPVLRGVSLQLAAGETMALTGESGSGKSTLLHLIGALDRPDKGEILIDGRDIAGMDDGERAQLRRQTVGTIFQQFNLVPSLNVRANLLLHARLAGKADERWADELTGKLGLRAQLAKYPEQLSGGQQQRVAIGRTLAARPKLVLADEPTGNLDERTADQVFELLLELVGQTQTGLLLVTHSSRLAGRIPRTAHLHAGRIE